MNQSHPPSKPKVSNDTTIEILELHPYEVQLLRNLRKNFRFGEITIIMKDGLPFRLKRIMEFADLDSKAS